MYCYPGLNFPRIFIEPTSQRYGRETVENINCMGSLMLDSTTVKGSVKVRGNLSAEDGVTIHGKVDVQGNLSAEDGVTIHGKVDVQGNLSAEDGVTIHGKVDILGRVTAINTKILNTLNVLGSTLKLVRSEVSGNVNALPVTNVRIKDSRIRETLTCASNHLVIEGSKIKEIVLNCQNTFSAVSFKNGLGGWSFSSSLSNYENIRIGNIYYFNGYMGREIPHYPKTSFEVKKDEEIGQILELKNCTVGDIVFEGKGEVILTGNSQVTGILTRGTIKG